MTAPAPFEEPNGPQKCAVFLDGARLAARYQVSMSFRIVEDKFTRQLNFRTSKAVRKT